MRFRMTELRERGSVLVDRKHRVDTAVFFPTSANAMNNPTESRSLPPCRINSAASKVRYGAGTLNAGVNACSTLPSEK
jgi:hypothetical protein